jgi:hypothetical protein
MCRTRALLLPQCLVSGQGLENLSLSQRQSRPLSLVVDSYYKVLDLSRVSLLARKSYQLDGRAIYLVTPEQGIPLFPFVSIPDSQ